MYTNIIGTQQILITAAFLGVMILLRIILRKKSTVIRANIKAGKRINIIEDTAVSPTERLRLLSVDSNHFIMLSAKGYAPSIICMNASEVKPVTHQMSDENVGVKTDEMKAAFAEEMEAPTTAKPFERLPSDYFLRPTGVPDINQKEKQDAFAERFKSWSQQNEVR